jgi:hypothetical protein
MKKYLLIVVLIAVLAFVYFYYLPPVKYWFNHPTNFAECKEATRGFIIKTKPAQCEFSGQNYVEVE